MKAKTIIKVSLVLIAIGIVFTGTGCAMNGSFSLNRDKFVYRDNYYKNINMISRSEELQSFKNIDIQVEANDIKIIPSEKYKIEVKYRENESKVDYKVEKDTLIIKQKVIRKNKQYNMNYSEHNKNIINIYVPKDIEFDNLNIDSDVCSMKFNDISAKYLDLSSDVGNVELDNCKIDEAILNTDAGNVEVNGLEALNVKSHSNVGNIIIENSNIKNSLIANNDLGNIEIDGNIYGEVDIKTNLGNIEVDINENEKLYNYNISNKLGGFQVDGNIYNKDLDINNNSENNINLKCSTGNIELNFK